MAKKKKATSAEEAEEQHEEHAHSEEEACEEGHPHCDGNHENSEEEKAKLEAKKKELAGKKIQEKDLVKLDILGQTVEEEPLTFMVCNEEDAKLMPNYNPEEHRHYHPRTYFVGGNLDVPDKVKEAIDEMEYFGEFELELEPEDAYGTRQGDKIKMIPARKIKKETGKMPHVGMVYESQELRDSGVIIRNNQGRCIVDFNHFLVDKKVKFTVKMVDAAITDEEKIEGTISKNFQGVPLKDFEWNLDEERNLEIILPQALVFNQQFMQSGFQLKFMLSMELQRNLDINDVKFSEIYKNFAKENAEEAAEKTEEEKEE